MPNQTQVKIIKFMPKQVERAGGSFDGGTRRISYVMSLK